MAKVYPMLTRKRVMAAKVEATCGTPVSLTAAEAVFNCVDPKINQTIEMAEREGQGSFSPIASVIGGHTGQMTFSIECYGGAALPPWASVLLPACGFAVSTLVLTPSSTPPTGGGTGPITITLGFFEDGVFKSLAGAMGNVKFTLTAGKIVRADFDYKGVWQAPVDAAILAPTYPTTLPLRFAKATTGCLLATAMVQLAELTIDMGNTVILREDPSAAVGSGHLAAVIVGRRVNGTMNPEARLVADVDYYGKFLASTEQALSVTMGATNNGLAISIPKLQITNIQGLDRNGIMANDITWQANKSAAAGDDEITLTFS